MKFLTSFLIVFQLGFTFSLFGQNNVNGLWEDATSSSAFSHCTAIFAQDGDSIFVTHYLEFNGQPFVEYGSGTIQGDTLIYEVKVTQQIPGWATSGTHQLILSEDKKTLKGTYTDNKGNTGELVFKKKR